MITKANELNFRSKSPTKRLYKAFSDINDDNDQPKKKSKPSLDDFDLDYDSEDYSTNVNTIINEENIIKDG